MPASPAEPGPYIERLLIKNYRGISHLELELEPDLTVLAGRNNAGKSRVISALHLALAGRPADADDFTAGNEYDPEIDIVIAPAPPETETDDEEFGGALTQLFEKQPQVLSETPLRERIGWRTTVTRDTSGVKADWRFLTLDSTTGSWVLRASAPSVATRQRRAFAVDFVNTGRDLRDELGRQGSSIRRVLADLEVPAEMRRRLEQDMEELSGKIMGESATLKSVGAELQLMHDLVGSVGEPALNALPGNLDELSRLISIDLDTGSGPLPIRLHGAGSRSLSSLQVQGVLYSRRLGQNGGAVAPTPVTLVEEPEAHLHPQAAMELPELLQNLRGQKIVSTHSAHLVTAVDPRAIRLIQTRDAATVAVDLGPADNSATATHRAFRPALHTQEMEKIRRLVERPFGELLFASSIVLGDGATERGFIPVVLRHSLLHRSHGVATIDAGSLGNELAKAVVKFAAMTNMPCTVFADSDVAGVAAVAELRSIAGTFPIRVVWINGSDEDGNPRPGAIEDMLLSFDKAMCDRVCERVRPGLQGTTMHRLHKIKGSSGRFLAQELIDSYPSTADWPAPIRALIETVGETS